MTSPLSKDINIIKQQLDEIVDKVNNLDFIDNDPICIPHRFSKLQDIEISAFFSAIFAWGNRKTIINKTNEVLELMGNDPYDFIMNHQKKDLKAFENFKHRTFQAIDLLYFIEFFRFFYQNHHSLEAAFNPNPEQPYSQKEALIGFNDLFFSLEFVPERTKKHVSTPAKNSTCKRLNMFLRWMVRKDHRGVDFGLWSTIPMSGLMIPFDVHVERYARIFGLLTRKQRDWIAVEEITQSLRQMNAEDPVIYDYALFGLGVALK
jgi:uncharacterized protein (TIGR02757 family)